MVTGGRWQLALIPQDEGGAGRAGLKGSLFWAPQAHISLSIPGLSSFASLSSTQPDPRSSGPGLGGLRSGTPPLDPSAKRKC